MRNEQLKPIRYYKRRLSDTELREMFDFPNNGDERPTPETDALREVIIGQYKEDELTGNGMGNILAALPDIESLERERDEWAERWAELSRAAIKDICAMERERDAERALADRLAMSVQILRVTLKAFHDGLGTELGAESLERWKAARAGNPADNVRTNETAPV